MRTGREDRGAAPQGRLRRLSFGAIAVAIAVAPVASAGTPGMPSAAPRLVAIEATPEEALRLVEAGIDLGHARVGGEVHAVLWPGDAERLDTIGLPWRILDVDLLSEHAGALLPDPEALRDAPSTEEPRTTYRTLAEHYEELRELATDHPSLVELIEVGRSLEGREILGVRVAIGDAKDGRPHAYFDGLHHAREWPSAEYVTGFAHRLVSDALAGEPRVSRLLERVAVILVPVVNPDGFMISRSTPHDGHETVFAIAGVGAYWRKNARGLAHDESSHASVGSYGVDPNRNYPFGWGSGTSLQNSGASAVPFDQTYEGLGPASEPEVAAVRALVLSTNVTALITNHTYGELILYPWGHTRALPPDIDVLRTLALSMAEANYYRPQPAINLYPTTGTMEDWAYAATGSLAYTFEHQRRFHPTYGIVTLLRAGNEEAFLRLVEAAADPAKHAVITGRVVDRSGAGVQASLRLEKTADVPLDVGTSPERIELELETAPDGRFTWHVNPSRGPVDFDDYVLTVDSDAGSASKTIRIGRGAVRFFPSLTVE